IGEAAFELAQRLAEGEVARRHESLELAPQVLTIAELLGQVRVAHAHTVRASVPDMIYQNGPLKAGSGLSIGTPCRRAMTSSRAAAASASLMSVSFCTATIISEDP